jgi:hypothetical protein
MMHLDRFRASARTGMVRAFFLSSLAFACLAAPAAAQAPPGHPGAAGGAASVPGLPTGDGRIVVEIVRRVDGAPQQGVDIALYALSPDGRPGLASGVSDADGRFAFEAISTDPGITYLAGAQFEGIPFGERVAFEPGSKEQRARIEVIEASIDGPALVVSESRVQIGWLGPHLLFEVTQLLQNPGEAVRNVPKDMRASTPALFETSLPTEFVEFAEAAVGFANGLERDGTRLRFYGPLYPGQQELRYRFTLAVPAFDPADPSDPAAPSEIDVEWPLPMGSGRLTVLTPTSGPEVIAPDALETREVEIEDVPFDSTRLPPVAAGARLALRLALPPSRTDPDAVHLERADYWIDSDDASVSVRAQIQVRVPPGPHVQASAGAPLLHIELPEGAEIEGVSTEAQQIGLTPSADGGLDLMGPVPAGDSSIEFGYGLATGAAGTTRIDLIVDRPLPVVNVLVADNGVAIESDRLHRRRPFRQGTRNYLHRRAFQLDANEPVSLQLTPLEDRAAGRSTSLAAMLLLAGGAAWFLVAPLRAHRSARALAGSDAPTRQREMIYGAIRDLDHDLETGKVDAADHAEMRARLRAEAIELVRREREGDADQAPQASAGAPAAAEEPDRPAAFCPQCGGRVQAGWRFCSHCGSELPSA